MWYVCVYGVSKWCVCSVCMWYVRVCGVCMYVMHVVCMVYVCVWGGVPEPLYFLSSIFGFCLQQRPEITSDKTKEGLGLS